MRAATKRKTDNKSIGNKIFLRRKATEHLKDLHVLDLFAGNNVLWRNIETTRYYGVELLPDKGANLNADAHQAINSLDVSAFNVIDCDTYGVPFEICRKLLENEAVQPGTVIVYTAICSAFTGVANECLDMFGLRGMYKIAPSLFNQSAVDLFYDMLAGHGVAELHYYEANDSYTKHYGYFIKP